MSLRSKLVNVALNEWKYFGGSTRSLDDDWHIAGDEAKAPFTKHISQYWAAVDKPEWDGATPEPWSAAFISWCFRQAIEEEGSKCAFAGDAKHSVYIDRIRRHTGMDSSLVLTSIDAAPLAKGDLIWNARGKGDRPKSLTEAIARLKLKDFFISHVDIVVEVSGSTCESIGGNVSNKEVGGSVTRSTWQLNEDGLLVDHRKTWLGIVKNKLP